MKTYIFHISPITIQWPLQKYLVPRYQVKNEDLNIRKKYIWFVELLLFIFLVSIIKNFILININFLYFIYSMLHSSNLTILNYNKIILRLHFSYLILCWNWINRKYHSPRIQVIPDKLKFEKCCFIVTIFKK